MKRSTVLLCWALGVGAAGVIWASRSSESPAGAPIPRPTLEPADSNVQGAPTVARLLPAPAPALSASVSAPLPSPDAPAALGSGETPHFAVDSAGNLVIDGQTRLELERLSALNNAAAALALLQQIGPDLPPAAYRQAVDAFHVYQNYTMALRQAFQPDAQALDETAAADQLQTLKALRVQQFGVETAKAYFDEEEAAAQHLLDDLRAHRATGTLEERVEQAQQRVTPPAR